MGRKIELIAEDSVNPQTASTKARAAHRARQGRGDRGRDQLGVGPRDRAGRAAQQDPVLQHRLQLGRAARQGVQPLHVPHRGRQHDVRVRGRAGAAARRHGQGQEVVQPDRRLRVRARSAARPPSASCRPTAAQFAADELVPTDATDFSPFLLKIRNAKPDLVVVNLAGAQITQLHEAVPGVRACRFPVAGFGFDTAVAWGAGKGNLTGIWPLVWSHRGEDAVGAEVHRGVHQEVSASRRTTRRGATTCRPSTSRRRWPRSRPPIRRRSPSTWRRARGSTC